MIASDTVKAGENIVSLASRLLGDPQAWTELVRLNRLRAPYLADEARPGVLSPGDAVLYPSPTAPAAPPDAARLAALTYKRDLRVSGRDLVLSGGHLTTEVGLPNLRTAITRRLDTMLGMHPFHPGYGSLLRTHLGRPADTTRLRLAAVDVRRAILRDPRVQECVVAASWQAEKMTLDIDVTPIPPGQRLRFTYTV